ncbi:stretch-activated Ca2+-permeable channel component-domain-containing protein [Lasiosphaeria hispida]|uniref:Stretch-activated Ca2+-permeable channel component-domain-containing protein n=1 Tax=Lasiosphaeria hispida TaxID=260671 RepID=A0AAJ0MH67_9PEZI|nr:stretch-activated Ca2+-permeable channel component-domain-containing protein [Lasiosphaeria hispida]
MQLSPLQSRLAASVIASCLLIALYFTLFSPHFALAIELKETYPVLLDELDIDYPPDLGARSPLDPTYEPEFSPFDRGIIGRAPAGVTALTNNEAMPMNVVPGTTQLFTFTVRPGSGRRDQESKVELRSEGNATRGQSAGAEAVEGTIPDEEQQKLERRQTQKTLYISANTCEQPEAIEPSKTSLDPPQLTMFVSTSSSNQSPGPLAKSGEQVRVEFVEGAAMYNFTTIGDVYIGVYAPNISKAFDGAYNFKIAASTDAFFDTYDMQEDADLIWVDSDAQGALLITHNLTESTDPVLEAQIMGTQPYVMFAQNKNDRSVNGLKFSYCGLQNYAQIAATKNGQFTSMVSTGMTKRGPGHLPKQQFYFSGLNSSANYIGILAQDGNASVSGNGLVGGGGHVFRAMNFSTKSDHGNCAIVLNLKFCDQVAYSVPSNPNFGNATKLAQFYDDYAASMYDNFNKSLAQIACEAPSTQRYSLARNCSDCAVAYKDWLCSVTIPRCEDFSNDAAYLQPRAMAQSFPDGERLDEVTIAKYPATAATNSSRNPLIDSVVQPGPYKEVLPCEDLCYNLVQSCPSAMGFSCPRPGDIGFQASYGHRKQAGEGTNGELTCNYPGSAHVFSAARRVGVEWGSMSVAVAAVIAVGFFLL